MEDFIDSRKKVKDWIKKLKAYGGIGSICWLKIIRTREHQGANKNKGRQYKTFKYAIQNTRANPDEYVAKVWVNKTQKFFKKLYRKINRRYQWQKNKLYYMGLVTILIVIVSIIIPLLIKKK